MEQKITALSVQKRNPQRVNVYINDEFAFGLSQITAAWLSIGQVLDASKIHELQAADESEVAYQKALHYLSFRTRSEAEIRKNLRKHQFSDEVADDVIERLQRQHLVDDLAFAQNWIENRSEFRPRGQRALQAELRQKGIANEIIADALTDIDEENLAYQAAVKQVRKYRQLEWQEFRQKMIAFLARRGFSYGVAAPAVQKIWSENRPASETENEPLDR